MILRRPTARHVAIWVGATMAAGWFLALNGALTSWEPFSGAPDIAADKYVAAASLSGGDPYQPRSQLIPGKSGWDAPHPRPPAAILLSVPLVVIPDGLLLVVMSPVTMGIAVFAVWLGSQITGVGEVWGWLGLAVLAAAGAVQQLVVSASATALFVPVLLAGWFLIERGGFRAGGALLGVAAAVKLWPAIVVFALVRRRTAAGWMIGSTASVTAAGLALPAVSLAGTIGALADAGSFFVDLPTNLSLVRFGWTGAAVGVSILGVAVWKQSLGGTVIAGLLLSPLTWIYYWLTALPMLASAAAIAFGGLRR